MHHTPHTGYIGQTQPMTWEKEQERFDRWERIGDIAGMIGLALSLAAMLVMAGAAVGMMGGF